MGLIVKLLINGFAVFVTAYLLPGVKVDGFLTAVIVSVVLGIVNTFIRPILLILTLPFNILTLGLFTLVLNGLMIYLVSAVVPGFSVNGIFSAIIFSIVLWAVNFVLHSLTK